MDFYNKTTGTWSPAAAWFIKQKAARRLAAKQAWAKRSAHSKASSISNLKPRQKKYDDRSV